MNNENIVDDNQYREILGKEIIMMQTNGTHFKQVCINLKWLKDSGKINNDIIISAYMYKSDCFAVSKHHDFALKSLIPPNHSCSPRATHGKLAKMLPFRKIWFC